MSGVTDFLFGGDDDSAQNAQLAQNRQQLALFESLARGARDDALNLFPAADENRNMGFNAALNALGQGTGQQIDAFQGGNVGAQNVLLNTLPQQNNAIMGLPTNLSGMQAQQLQFDPSFLNQQVPEFVSTGQVAPGPLQQQANLGTFLAALADQGNTAGGTQNSGGFFNGNTSPTGGDVHGTPASEMSMGNLANAIGAFGGTGLQAAMFGGLPMGMTFAMNAAANNDMQNAANAFGAMDVADQMNALTGLSPEGLASFSAAGGNIAGLGGPGSLGSEMTSFSSGFGPSNMNSIFAQSTSTAAGNTGADGGEGGDPGYGGGGASAGNAPTASDF